MKKLLQKYLPVFNVLKEYSATDFKSDAVAGLTVGIVLIPQGMAYAVIAGLPPIYGLYAGLLPLLIYPFLATSRHLSVGPVALDMLILSAGLGLLAGDDLSQKITLAVLIAMMTGIFQIAMGLMNLGFIFNLFSRPVISGFTIAAPIIIIASQLGTLLNIDLESSQYIYEIAMQLFIHIQDIHWPTLLASVLFIGLLILFKKTTPRLPESVVVVVITLVVASFINLDAWGIQEVETIPQGLPSFDLHWPGFELIKELAPTALTLSLIQFMTIASLAKAFSRRYEYSVNPNQELIAIGSSNLIGGMFSSLPVSASFSRSAINEQSGGRTALTNWFAAALIFLTLLFLTPVFEILPMPLLAAIIVVSVSSLIDVKEIKFLFNTKRRDAIVALITFLSVLVIGIQEGIIIGIISSVVAILIKLGKPTVAELGIIPDTRTFKNLKRFEEASQIPGILILRIDASFSFVNAQFFKNFILEQSIDRDKHTQYVIIDGSTIGDLDVSAIDTLVMIIDTLNEHGIELYISGLIGPVRDVIWDANMSTIFKHDRFFNTVHEAVEAALKKIDDDDRGNRLKDYQEVSL